MDAIKQTFFQECEEQLALLETGLLALEIGEADGETINAVFRAVHSIKGGAAAFELESLVRFSHVFESALDDLRAGRLAPDPDSVIKAMLRAADVLADLVRAARDGGSVDETRSAALATELGALCVRAATIPGADAGDDPDFEFTPVMADLAKAAPSAWTIHFKPRSDLYAKANETALLLRELALLGEVTSTLDVSALPDLADLDPEGAYLSWTIALRSDCTEAAIHEVFEFAEWDCDLEILGGDHLAVSVNVDILALIDQAYTDTPAVAGAQPDPGIKESLDPPLRPQPSNAKNDAVAPTAAAPTIRVDLERVDRLVDLVGELVINQAMLTQRVTEAGLGRASGISAGLDELEQLSREIQDSVMAIRAQPVKSIFQRMPRVAREVASLTGKQVRLVTDGEGTEVDKTVIEHLADPLTHMIRNAIDHGLESPAARIEAGKPAEGTVRLSARHRSGRIVIEVSDDGAGINRSSVKRIAAHKGLIAADAALSDEDIDNLIFLPGFSTVSEVSDVSGRGVGMDVVRSSIQALGGRISISSVPAKGATFTMSLPLTLAVLDGMVVTVADQSLVCPLTTIIETLQPKASDVHRLGGDTRVIAFRGAFVPLIDVGQALGFRGVAANAAAGVVLLIESETGARFALLVDAIQGQRQVVIKSLEANYRQVQGIAAATILGDGRVALILDIDTLVALSRTQEPSFELQPALVN